MTEQQPTVGRIVHYYAGDTITDTTQQRTIPSNYPPDQPLAAIITEVTPQLSRAAFDALATGIDWGTAQMIVRLDIRYPGVQDPMPHYGPYYPYSETPKPGHWTWPPRT